MTLYGIIIMLNLLTHSLANATNSSGSHLIRLHTVILMLPLPTWLDARLNSQHPADELNNMSVVHTLWQHNSEACQ